MCAVFILSVYLCHGMCRLIPKLVPCRLHWKNDTTLIIGWEYCVKVIYIRIYAHAVYSKTFEEENLCGFRGFSLNRKSFPTNYGLVNWQYNSTSMLPKVFQQTTILHSKCEGFPLESCHIL